MKKIAYAVIALALSCSAVSSCDSSNKANNDEKKTASAAQQGEAFSSESNIRYIDLDTILEHYEFAKFSSSEVEQLAREYQQVENSYGSQIQNRANQIQTKLNQNGYLTEESYRADEREFNKLQTNAQNVLSRKAQETQKLIAEKQDAVLDSINNYIVRYNKDKKYDAILFKNAGIYFNPSLDITSEIIEGLNAAYKKPAEAAAKADEKK